MFFKDIIMLNDKIISINVIPNKEYDTVLKATILNIENSFIKNGFTP